MSKDKIEEKCCDPKISKNFRNNANMGGGVYGLAFIGAAVYFIQHSDTFWIGVLGVLKAIIWPALVVYKLLGFFGL